MTAVRVPLPGYLAAAVNKLDRVFAGALPEPEKRLHWWLVDVARRSGQALEIERTDVRIPSARRQCRALKVSAVCNIDSGRGGRRLLNRRHCRL